MFPAAFILLALTVLQILDPGPAAASDDPQLAQLFHDMMIIKSAKVGIPVEIRLNDMDVKTVSLSDFRGKIVFLNFWTTWCPTCRIEMPSMEKLHQKFKDGDFALVAINLQEPASRVKEFFKEFKLTFTALLDTGGEVGDHVRHQPDSHHVYTGQTRAHHRQGAGAPGVGQPKIHGAV